MGKKKKTFEITQKERDAADNQIRNYQRQIDYDTKDYTIELLLTKFNREDFFIPDYQRNFIWKDSNKTLFLESVFLGLPIPFMFFADTKEGKQEIIDGAQRMQTLVEFCNNNLKLSNLKKLTALEGFRFNDLSKSQQRKFLNNSIRIVILAEDTPDESRQDLFYRINTTGVKALPSEIRRGSYAGPFTDFIEKCATNELFVSLTPMNEDRAKRQERFELVLRFFAFTNKYLEFGHQVETFLDEYLQENTNTFEKEKLENEFNKTMEFVKRYFPAGFAKSKKAKSTPRVRFEAISIGTALALQQNPDLVVDNVDWLESEEFKRLTTSDASNNEGKLKSRVEFVRDHLLRDH